MDRGIDAVALSDTVTATESDDRVCLVLPPPCSVTPAHSRYPADLLRQIAHCTIYTAGGHCSIDCVKLKGVVRCSFIMFDGSSYCNSGGRIWCCKLHYY